MAKQSINLGSSANDGTGTTIRAGGDIVNDNFNELYAAIGTGSNLQITVSGASNGQALIYSSSNSRFEPANQSGGLSDIVGDTSPQLGGDLDVNSNGIISASNGNIPITPNGSGKIILDGLDWPTGDGSGGQFLQTNGSSQLAFATVLQNVAEDTSPQLGANLDVQTNEITTSTSNGNIKLNANGTGVVEVKGDGSSADGTVQLNCSQNSHGIKLASPPHSAAQSYTLTFPQTAPVANKLLQTDGSGNLSFSSDLTLDSLTMSGSGNVTFTAATTLALNANTGGTVVVNDGSNNADFRVESDNNANMLFVDAGSDHVNIGTSTDHGGVLNVEHGDNTDTLMLVSTDADGSVGPNLTLYRNSASPADADDTGIVNFRGRNDNSQDVEYAQIKSIILDQTDGTEDGKLELYHMLNGSLAPSLQLTSSEVVINESSNDLDFRVESNNNSGMLFVNAGSDHVSVGTDGDLGGVFNVSGETVMRTSGNSDTLTLKCTDADAEQGPILRLARDSSSPANDDVLGRIFFTGEDAGSNATNYVQLTSQASNVAEGSETANFQFEMFSGGSNVEFLKFEGGTGTVFNEGSNDLDFRIESDGNANMFKVDAGNNQVLIGGTNATFGELGITGHGNGDANIDMYASVGASAIGKAEIFFSTDSSSDHVSIASIVAQQPTGDEASRKGEILFNVSDNGGPATAMTIQNNKNVIFNGGAVFNEASADADFRVETDANANAFKIDAGNNVAGFNSTSDSYQLMIENQNAAGGRVGVFVNNPSSSDTGTGFNARSSRSSSLDQNHYILTSSNNGSDTEFKVRGDGNVFCDGAFSGGGADYAEYFEWADGNSSDEDRVGYSVVLDNNKIVKATDSDDASKIIGVISVNPAVVGDGDIDRWKQKFLLDDFGREVTEEITITEWKGEWTGEDGILQKQHIFSYDTDRIPSDVTVPSDAEVKSVDENGNKFLRRKTNPDWDKDMAYISREDRKEWDTVGLMGKLRLRKGQPTGTNWIKMRDISDTVEEWLVR